MSSEGHDASSRQRLLRSRSDRVLTGTAAGIAAYANVDPAIVRTGFVVLCFLTFGLAGLAYSALSILMPEQKEGSDQASAPAAVGDAVGEAPGLGASICVGAALVAGGAVGIAWVFDHLDGVNLATAWGIGIIALGVLLVLRPRTRR